MKLNKDILLLMVRYTDDELEIEMEKVYDRFDNCFNNLLKDDELLDVKLPVNEFDFEVDMVKSFLERINRYEKSITEIKNITNYRFVEELYYDKKYINCLIECERIDGSVYNSYHSFEFDEKRYQRISRKLKLKRVKGV